MDRVPASRGTRRTAVGFALGAALASALAPLTAAADTVDANATTLFQGMQAVRDGQVHTVLPLMELVSINARNLENPLVGNLSMVISGWGGIQGGDSTITPPGLGPGATGDLSLAYIEGSEFHDHLQVRLGRQMVTGGAAQVLSIDGASVTVLARGNIGITAYGGGVVVPRFASSEGDAAAGFRAFWRWSFDGEVGISFVDVLEHGITAREEVGVDAHLVPWRGVTLTGFALVSTLELRLAEGAVTATWQPLRDLQLTAAYRRTAPDLFISAASIFSVFAEEQQDEIGGSIFYRFSKVANCDADFQAIETEEGWGNRAQLRANFHLGPAVTLGIQGKELLLQVAPAGAPPPFMPVTEAGKNGYWAAIGFGVLHFTPSLFSTFDLEAYKFRAPVNGQENSFTGELTLNYDIQRVWRFSLAGRESVTPLLAQGGEIIARVSYSPALGAQEKRP
jgi:hypothetical protein